MGLDLGVPDYENCARIELKITKKGIRPPIIAETPKRAIKFFCFSFYQKELRNRTSLSVPMCGSIGGLGSGLTEGFFVTPFERVKILLQNQKGSLKGNIILQLYYN